MGVRKFPMTRAEFLRQKAIQHIEEHKSKGFDLTDQPIDELVRAMLSGPLKGNDLKLSWIAEYDKLVAGHRNRRVTYP